MKLLIEGYPYKSEHRKVSKEGYNAEVLYNALKGLVNDTELESNNSVSVPYVGYFYSRSCNDVVFCLPKVVLTGGKINDEAETVFGISPEKLVDFDKLTADELDGDSESDCAEIKNFLSELAIWIYRTISVYHVNYPNSKILKIEQYNTSSEGNKSKFHTLFDVIIALRDFNKENKNYFTFVARNLHSGNNKIQWSKTISKSHAIIQDGTPVYLNPVNKRKVLNFDEELFVIYFSILRYISKTYGFRLDIDINYELIEGSKFEAYRNGKGKRRLKAIKYKYFSDKDLRMWNLCYAFFDITHDIAINMARQDFMLVDDFQIVFENVIDDLLGDKIYDKKSKNQADGKNIDHLYKGQSLLAHTEDLQTYYIADSKYYKRSERATTEEELESYTALHGTSIPKQFTYARNLIQWNLDLFLKDNKSDCEIPLRPDELTEGYNVIPNFFISAFIPDEKHRFDFKYDGVKPQSQVDFSRQFENRLFDRDTLLLYHYDVNFLFVVSLYGRDNKSDQNTWKSKVRDEFRKKVQQTLDDLYVFYVLSPKQGMNCYQFVKDNFHQLNGKLFRPKPNSDCLILALMKKDAENGALKKIIGQSQQGFKKEIQGNDSLISALSGYFDGSDCPVVLRDDSLAKKFVEAENNQDKGNLDIQDNNYGDDYVLLIRDFKSENIFISKHILYLGMNMDSINLISNYIKVKFVYDIKSQTFYDVKDEINAVNLKEVQEVMGTVDKDLLYEMAGTPPKYSDFYLRFHIEINNRISISKDIELTKESELKQMKDCYDRGNGQFNQ